MHNNYTCVKLLLNLKGIVLKAEDQSVPSPFHIACKLGNDKIILALLEELDIESIVEPYNGDMAIHFLVDHKEEKLETTRAILQKINQGKHFVLYHTVLNALTHKRYSLLQVAMENRHFNIVNMILQEFYPKDFCPDGNGNNPTHLAACNGNLEFLNIIVKNNAVSFVGNKNDENPLHLAASKNKPEFIAKFLKLEADYISKNESDTDLIPCVRKRNKSGQTPLFSAVDVDNEKCVEALLKSKDIEKYSLNAEGDSIVHVCAKLNNVESLRYLLKNEQFFDLPFIQNPAKETPFHIAAKLGNLEIIKLIMEVLNKGTRETKESCLTLGNNLGRTCFHLACLNNQFTVVEYLILDLKLLFLIEITDNSGDSGMHLAAMNGNHIIVDLITQACLNSKSIIMSRNHEGLTPLEISLSRKFFKTSRIFIDAFDGTINTENNKINLLHVAVFHGAYEIVELLLEKKVPIDSVNAERKNALDIAIEKEHKDVIKVLLNDPEWKKLFQHQRSADNQSNLEIGFLQIRKCVSHFENPQFVSLYEKEYWDIFHIILENSKIGETVFDLEVLNPPLGSVGKHPLMLMVMSGQQLLIKHDSTRALIHLKWAVIPRLIFYSQLLFYLMFIIFFALYSTELTELNFANLETNSSINDINEIWLHYGYESDYKYILGTMQFIMCLMMVFKIFLFGFFKHLFRKSSFLEAGLILLSYMAIYSENMSDKIQYTSLAILVMFIKFSLLLQKVPKFGIYVLAFQRTLINSARFIPMTILTYSAFLLAFRVRSDTNLTLFTNLTTADALIKGLTMALGDYKTDEMGIKESPINYSLYILFIGVMSIIILNLLVGIAVGELNQTLEQADVQYISMRIRFCLQVQNSLKLFMKFKGFNSLYKIMDKSYYNKSKHSNKAVAVYYNLKDLLKINSEPEIVLDDPQTRLDNAICNLAVKNDKNFKTIQESIDKNIYEMNEKLKSSKQRLEDCLVELSRKTETNFESNAEDSNDALDSVEAKLTRLLVDVSNKLFTIEILFATSIRSSRESIIQHIKNSNLIVTNNFRMVFERLNIKESVKDGTRQIEPKSNQQNELKDIINLFNTMNKRVDKIETNLASLYEANLKNHKEILKIINDKLGEVEGESAESVNKYDSVDNLKKHFEELPSKTVSRKVVEKIPKDEKLPKIKDKIAMFSSADWTKINEITEENRKKSRKSIVD